MSRIPSIAVVLEGGLVQSMHIEDWPCEIPLPRIAVVDYDTEGACDDEITRFPIGNTLTEAVCRDEIPVVYENAPDTLSPAAVLTALGVSVDNT